MPVTLIGEAVFSRCLSAIKDERVAAASGAQGPPPFRGNSTGRDLLKMSRCALYCSKIVSYAQGYMLLREAARDQKMEFELRRDCPDVAWRMYYSQPFPRRHQKGLRQKTRFDQLASQRILYQSRHRYQAAWRRAIIHGVKGGVPTPAFSTALAFYDGYRTGRLPANLLQAQRDFFGAHTYERIDQPRASSSIPTGPVTAARWLLGSTIFNRDGRRFGSPVRSQNFERCGN